MPGTCKNLGLSYWAFYLRCLIKQLTNIIFGEWLPYAQTIRDNRNKSKAKLAWKMHQFETKKKNTHKIHYFELTKMLRDSEFQSSREKRETIFIKSQKLCICFFFRWYCNKTTVNVLQLILDAKGQRKRRFC